jgi:hypothetical protein
MDEEMREKRSKGANDHLSFSRTITKKRSARFCSTTKDTVKLPHVEGSMMVVMTQRAPHEAVRDVSSGIECRGR